MRVRFWGVRGSTPTPHRDYLAYGGNTSCVEVRTADDAILILDAGTGIRLLGKALEQEFGEAPICAHMFFSHFHLDHIQGLPFFKPLYAEKNHVTFYFGERNAGLPAGALDSFMSNPYFPVDISNLPCRRDYRARGEGAFRVADVEVLVKKLNHPQGCLGYRIAQHGRAVAYCTDLEPGPAWSQANFDALAAGADCLIVDAQYTPEEYPRHVGWGHSTWKQSVENARAANVRQVVLFHHDPYHDDEAVDGILAQARALHPNVIAAREGMSLEI